MIKVGIIGSGNWALALTKILANVEIVIKARKLDGLKNKFSAGSGARFCCSGVPISQKLALSD